MPSSVELRHEGRILVILNEGEVFVTDAARSTEQALEIMSDGVLRGVLIDSRKAEVISTESRLKQAAEDFRTAVGDGLPTVYMPPEGMPEVRVNWMHATADEFDQIFAIIEDEEEAVAWLLARLDERTPG